MTCFRDKDAIRTRNALALVFNPRGLVVNWTPPERLPAGDANAELHAIYVPTRFRAEHVSRLLAELPNHGTSIYLLPTLGSDLPSTLSASYPHVEHLSFQDPEFLGAMQQLRCLSTPLFAVTADQWDLPLKRNYALWHAHKHRFRQILLVDDDIRGLDAVRLRAGASALSRWTLAGFFVDDFPDTSVVGHVELAVGEPVLPFLSGSCLFVRLDTQVGFFPPIYNEDWIFMTPEIAQGHVISLGFVNQDAYDPFTRASLSTFQEPGEVIADGLFSLLTAGRYEERFDPSAWRTLLSLRRDWLKCLAGRAKNPRHRSAVDRAQVRCDEISELECAGFIKDWEHDRAQWTRTLEELK